ncbi:UNVERIFIED_CONTAM: hypothetical protein Sangu_0016900 [Sesamum angustifolium]|uniref:Uncharacterized protein n=1 Tax=Sesamum angustifolium TaxID=2727405 RepID=A0AAW2RJ53_9LAMI
MSTQLRNDDESDPQEAAAAEEVLKLEAEVQQMAEKLLEYRATLPDQLHSTLSSLLASQRPFHWPVYPLKSPDPKPGRLPGRMPKLELPKVYSLLVGLLLLNLHVLLKAFLAFVGLERTVEVEKIQLLKQKMSDNALTLPVVLKRMEVYMGKIEELASSDGVIHPAFKRKRVV